MTLLVASGVPPATIEEPFVVEEFIEVLMTVLAY